MLANVIVKIHLNTNLKAVIVYLLEDMTVRYEMKCSLFDQTFLYGWLPSVTLDW
jgi:hypothetical protein